VPNLHFVYFTLPFWSNGWRWGLGAMQLHYYLWQIQAYFVAIGFIARLADLMHHVTFGKYWGPSFLSYFLYPSSGVQSEVENLHRTWRDFSLHGKIYEILRDLACWLGKQDPFITPNRPTEAPSHSCNETSTRLRALVAKRIEMVFGQTGINQQNLSSLRSLLSHQ